MWHACSWLESYECHRCSARPHHQAQSSSSSVLSRARQTCTTAPASGFTHLLPGQLSAAHSPARGSEAGSRAVGSNPQRGLATMAVSDTPMLLAYGMRVAGLPAMDRNGKADPYLKLSVRSCAACTCMRGVALGQAWDKRDRNRLAVLAPLGGTPKRKARDARRDEGGLPDDVPTC